MDLTAQDYSDRTLWKQLGLGRDADEVRASLTGTSVTSNGALTLTATRVPVRSSPPCSPAPSASRAAAAPASPSPAPASTPRTGSRPTPAPLITGDGADGHHAPRPSPCARPTRSGIQALAGAASIAVSLAPSNAISVALALSIAFNEVSNHVEAAVDRRRPGHHHHDRRRQRARRGARPPAVHLHARRPRHRRRPRRRRRRRPRRHDDHRRSTRAPIDAAGDAPILAQLATQFTGAVRAAQRLEARRDPARPGVEGLRHDPARAVGDDAGLAARVPDHVGRGQQPLPGQRAHDRGRLDRRRLLGGASAAASAWRSAAPARWR